MNNSKLISRAVTATAAITVSLLTACSAQAPGQLGELQALAKTCPSHSTQLDAYIGDDVSGTARDITIATARDSTIKSIATKVAVCGGHLHVDAFAGSSAASTVVFDDDLKPDGATQIAKLRKVDDLVKSTMATIDAGLSSATKSISPDGSDITSQFGMASEYASQTAKDGTRQLTVDLLTDGIQTVGVVLNTQALTVATATSLAKTAPVATLPSSTTVKVSGLGKTAGTPAPTSYVQALQAFFLTYCNRTGAQSCAAVVDYTA